MLSDNWLYEEWQELKLIQNELDDDTFLKYFESIYKTFIDREPYLRKCADYISKLYNYYDKNNVICSVLEPASGCNIFPEILNLRGFKAMGLEPEGSPAARFCKIRGKPIIIPHSWDTMWCRELFDLLVLICYYTGPEDEIMGEQSVNSLSMNIFDQIINGAEFVLFDTRYADYIIKEIVDRSLPITWRKHNKRRNVTEFYIFHKYGTKSPFRYC